MECLPGARRPRHQSECGAIMTDKEFAKEIEHTIWALFIAGLLLGAAIGLAIGVIIRL
jgi:hypothetical protein